MTLCTLPSRALASGAFISPVAVDAVKEPDSKEVVFHVEANTGYPLLKKGGPGRAWCKLQGATAQGWVKCEDTAEVPDKPALSGEFLAARDREAQHKAQPTEGAQARGCSTRCDKTPLFAKAPELSAADREVLALCPARPDAAVSQGDVQRFMAAHYDDPRLQRALSAAGRAGSRQANLEWLTSLWVSTGPRNAFTHVFCGDDWTTREIGGLHFLPRYAQLESEGKVCFDGPAHGGQAIKGGQYMVRFHGVAPWSCGNKKLGGFVPQMEPAALVALGTRAFARCCSRDGGKREGGVYSASDLGGVPFHIWCGTRNGSYGIASLYPTDERPTCGE